MTTLRLLADDLTGALDTAAEFVGRVGPVPTFWDGAIPASPPANAAFDTATRERAPEPACAVVASLAGALTDATIAFKKIDSLLRGNTLAELAACLRVGHWDSCVLAPAFPYQGRMTRDGWQYLRTAGQDDVQVGPDLPAALRDLGVTARRARCGDGLAPGVNVFDAESDADLASAVAAGRRHPGRVLWCGTGGLAGALAGRPPPSPSPLPRPILGLFGTDQATTTGQLAACGAHWLRLSDGGPADAARLASRLAATGMALASLDMPDGLTRHDAAARIGRAWARLVSRLPAPGTLVVAGGETLRGLCGTLGATSLEVQGRIVPGLPCSVLRGGRWDGVAVVSKSGAFGHPGLLRDLLPLATLERTA